MAVNNMDAASVAQRWVNGMSSARDRVTAGVNATNESPMAKAAANVSGYVAGVNAAAQRWAQKLANMPISRWKDGMIQKGIQNMATAAASPLTKSKVQSALSKILPAVHAAVQSLPQRGSYEQNKARALALMDALHAQRGNLGAS